jgi:hypothetical protein
MIYFNKRSINTFGGGKNVTNHLKSAGNFVKKSAFKKALG